MKEQPKFLGYPILQLTDGQCIGCKMKLKVALLLMSGGRVFQAVEWKLTGGLRLHQCSEPAPIGQVVRA